MNSETTRYGKKMYLVSPSMFNLINRKKLKRPFYENQNASDFKSQLSDEKIRAEQIAKEQSKQKQIEGLSELVKPILSNVLLTAPQESKEKIRSLLSYLKQQPNVSILNDKLSVGGEDYPLNKFISDLLSDSDHFQSNIAPLVRLMVKSGVDTNLVPNVHIVHLMEKEKEGETDPQAENEEPRLEQSSLGRSANNSQDGESSKNRTNVNTGKSVYNSFVNSPAKGFTPDMNSTVYDTLNDSTIENNSTLEKSLPAASKSLPLLNTTPVNNLSLPVHPASDSKADKKREKNQRKKEKKKKKEKEKEEEEEEEGVEGGKKRASARDTRRPLKYGKGIIGGGKWVHF